MIVYLAFSYGVLHGLHEFAYIRGSVPAVLLEELDDSRADDSTVGHTSHLSSLFRLGDTEADSTRNVRILAYNLDNAVEVGSYLTSHACNAEA